MDYIFELSGEHNTLPKAEVLASLNAEGIEYRAVDSNRALIIESEKNLEKLEERLALTHYIDKRIFSCKLNELLDKAENIELGEGSFCVRVKNLSKEKINTLELESKVGEVMAKKNKVDLENPDYEVRIVISQMCHVGVRLAKINRAQFENRKVQFRPFFSPISLHPRHARALVNLSRAGKGQTIIDPFCGTGGILIEAGLIGLKVVGSDVEDKMVRGCKENLEFFGISDFELYRADVAEIAERVRDVDAIITDPPYGRATTTKGEDIEKLYVRAFSSFRKVLGKKRFLAISLFDKGQIDVCRQFFDLVEVHEMRVHRSLTRYFCVFQNRL